MCQIASQTLMEYFHMTLELSQSELIEFLILAKTKTYASGGCSSETSVNAVLECSHQLEFRSGDLLYRDIYFGEAYFVGQETVYYGKDAIWSMSYAGGWTDELTDLAEANVLGGFLQSALRNVPTSYPFRGPLEHRESDYLYKNTPSGDVNRFSGIEHIIRGGDILYELNYCGGCLR